MAIKGFCESARCLIIPITTLLLSGPASAQHVFTVLPHQVEGDENPFTFIRTIT